MKNLVTYPFTMVVGAHFAMRAAIGAFGPIGFILGVAPDKEQVRYLILNEMVASMIANPWFKCCYSCTLLITERILLILYVGHLAAPQLLIAQ